MPDIPVPITHGPRRSYHSKALCHTRSITIQKGKVALQKFTTHFPTLLLQNCNMVGNRVSIWCQISSDNIEKVGFEPLLNCLFCCWRNSWIGSYKEVDTYYKKLPQFVKRWLYNFVLMIIKELSKIWLLLWDTHACLTFNRVTSANLIGSLGWTTLGSV